MADNLYDSKLYRELPKAPEVSKVVNPLPAQIVNNVLPMSSEDMSAIPDNSIQMMITSPPYNVGKDYDEDLSLEEHLAMLRRVFSEVYRVLVDGGRACINIANIGRKPYIPLSSYVSLMMIDLGFNMRGEIIWDKGASSGSSTGWGSWRSASCPVMLDTHEYITVFNKGDYKRHLGEKEDTEISKVDFIAWVNALWHISTESATAIGHPAPFPVEVPRRLLTLYSFPGDIVLDPFMGSGTTAVAAIRTGRKFVGFEISPEYLSLIDQRIEHETLRLSQRSLL